MRTLVCAEGKLSSADLKGVAEAVEEHGGGFADVTTRGDLLVDLPESVSLPAQAPEQGARDALQSAQDPVGVHESEAGLFWVGVPLPAGRVSAGQMRKTADLAERYGDGAVRFTSRQGILLLKVPQEKVVNVMEGLQSVDLKPQGSMLRRGFTVCSGTEACAEGWGALSQAARGLLEHLEKQVLVAEPLQIRVAGPSCACAPSAEEQVLIRCGAETGPEQAGGRWEVHVGGRLLIEAVPRDEVKFLLERLLVSWKRRREAGEALDAFCARIGCDQIARQLAETPIR
ncbi:MAG: hypothetical protein HYZ94_00980 [Candidatus Omnitrophica bacterium]|nr:hypothetical protein [Candidatus Omnitrophota bacterium]